jgi:hypothetical protein
MEKNTNAFIDVEGILYERSNYKKSYNKISIQIQKILYKYIKIKNVEMVKILTSSMKLWCPLASIGP